MNVRRTDCKGQYFLEYPRRSRDTSSSRTSLKVFDDLEEPTVMANPIFQGFSQFCILCIVIYVSCRLDGVFYLIFIYICVRILWEDPMDRGFSGFL